VLRGRECLSVPGAAALPLRGRAPGVGGRGRGRAGAWGKAPGRVGRVGRVGAAVVRGKFGARAQVARAMKVRAATCRGGKGKAEEEEEEGARESLVQELPRVADRFQAGGRLYEHCLAEFGRGLTVETAIQQLVWAHAHAPEGAKRPRQIVPATYI
jgi:hypothetical protein